MLGQLAVLVTVGLSLLDHYDEWRRRQDGRRVCRADLRNRLVAEGLNSGFWRHCRETIADRSPRQAKPGSYPSAELQTLAIWLDTHHEFLSAPAWPPEIFLFHGEGDDDASTCADVLGNCLRDTELVGTLFGRRVDEPPAVSPVPYCVNVRDQAAFSEGAVDLLTKVRQTATDCRRSGYRRVVVCMTGGYKAFTPFLALLGFLDGEEVIYGYETSDSVLTIPQLPVAFDLAFLDEYRTLAGRREIADHVYKSLPPRLRQFYLGPVPSAITSTSQKAGAGAARYVRSPFGEMVVDDYNSGRSLRHGYGRPLLERLRDESLRDRVEALLKTDWNHLWLGDQIPETVEHARGHSTRLMELAEQFFALAEAEQPAEPEAEPAAKPEAEPTAEPAGNRVGLGDNALWSLIAAIWLHDVGHTVAGSKRLGCRDGKAFPVGLFPSFVREYHHVLSHERLAEMEKKAAEAQRKDSRLPSPDTFHTVATLALYHRGKMPLVDGDWSADHFGLKEPALAKRRGSLSVEGQPLELGDVLFVAGLLRFLDGCDVQADRVVDPHYGRARRKRNLEEVNALAERLEWALPAARRSSGAAASKEVDDVSHRVLKSPLLTGASDANREPLHKEVLALASRLWNEDADPALLICLGLADSILFKIDQVAHYEKHESVGTVWLERGNPTPDGRLALRVRLLDSGLRAEPAEEAGPPEDRVREMVTKIANSIAREYDRAATVLQDYFILEGIDYVRVDGVAELWPSSEKAVPEGVSA